MEQNQQDHSNQKTQSEEASPENPLNQQTAPIQEEFKSTINSLEEQCKQLQTQLQQKEEEIAKQKDYYLRGYSDLKNDMNRALRNWAEEKENLSSLILEKFILALLNGIDNLERALQSASQFSENSSSINSLKEGVRLTFDGLMDTLKKYGVEKIKTIGEFFDPNFHEVISQEESELEANRIIREEFTGYTLNKRLLRAAKVVISQEQKKTQG